MPRIVFFVKAGRHFIKIMETHKFVHTNLSIDLYPFNWEVYVKWWFFEENIFETMHVFPNKKNKLWISINFDKNLPLSERSEETYLSI